MPIFRSTKNILTGIGEIFDENWFNKEISLPPRIKWDYERELKIEDIDIWESIVEFSGGGVFASWSPYAEFYMIVINKTIDSTYYGNGSDIHAAKRLDELKISYPRKNDTMVKR